MRLAIIVICIFVTLSCSPLDYTNRCSKLIDSRNYEKAIEICTNAIETNPTQSGLYNERGIAKENLGYFEEALLDYDKAIELNESAWFTYFNRCWVLGTLERYNESLIDCDKATKINPKNAILYAGRAQAKFNNGDKNGALIDAKKAIELDPKEESHKYLYEMLNGSSIGDYIPEGEKVPKRIETKNIRI